MRATIADKWRSRDLASAARSGRFARDKAWDRNTRFVRRNWWRLVVLFLLVGAASFPAALTYDGNARSFVVGTGVATAFWVVMMAVMALSGTFGALSGLLSETFVADELRRLRRHGWRIVNGLTLRSNTDIDHIAIGPGGVLVIETKYSESAWPVGCPGDRFMASRLADAVDQVARNRWDVSHHAEFKRAIGSAPVRAVLVVDSSEAPPDGSPEWLDRDGVTVLHARYLQRWLATLDSGAVEPAHVVRIWTELAMRVGTSDERGGSPRPTLAQNAQRLFGAVSGFWATLFVAFSFARLVGPWALVGIFTAAAVSAAAVHRKRDAEVPALVRGVQFGAIATALASIAVALPVLLEAS